MARLREIYRREIVPKLMAERGHGNPLAVPRVEKICLNMGVGLAREDRKILEEAVETLTLIAGQRAVVTRARQSISNFKLRKGFEIGCRVTLRGAHMYEFLDRLVNVALPRIRDFRGLSPRAFDGQGNYTVGLVEQTVFPEIDADKVQHTLGMNVTIVTTAETDEDGRALLRAFGLPLREE
jgi:large subunit ribosomal protein L5